MEFSYPAEVDAFRNELREYLDATVTPELEAEIALGWEGAGPQRRAFWRRLGADGYLGLGWPSEYGGQGKSALFLHVFNHEMEYRHLPVPMLGLNTVGPALIRYGSEEQKQQFLPEILKGEAQFSIGYSEPDAGTDLASLKTRAVRDGDEWVINGQKIFTSGAEQNDFLWMAVRTDPEAPKHRGISVLIVPLDSPGIQIQPFITTSGRTNLTFYDNVRVPSSALVGEENRGWYYIATQLDFERLAISPVPELERLVDDLTRVMAEESSASRHSWSESAFAAMKADVEVLKVLEMKCAWMVANGLIPVAEASMIKVLSNEFRVRHLMDTMQMFGPVGLLGHNTTGSLRDGSGDNYERRLKWAAVNLFGGGSNDIQRDLMATHGLRLPR